MRDKAIRIGPQAMRSGHSRQVQADNQHHEQRDQADGILKDFGRVVLDDAGNLTKHNENFR